MYLIRKLVAKKLVGRQINSAFGVIDRFVNR